MSFLKYLQGIGDRLGILETVENPESQPARRIQTRTITLEALSGLIQTAGVRALADSPAELSLPFEKIFEAAGIPVLAGRWTVETIKHFVSGEAFKNLPKKEVQKALLERLKADGENAEDIVKNAIARDQALDSFERSLCEKVENHRSARNDQIKTMEAQVQALREQIARLQETGRSDERQLAEWKTHKRAYERELALAIGYIVDHPVITTDDE